MHICVFLYLYYFFIERGQTCSTVVAVNFVSNCYKSGSESSPLNLSSQFFRKYNRSFFTERPVFKHLNIYFKLILDINH
jgi:hypothetical protein